MKAIKKYSRGGVNPHEPLTEEEKKRVELLFDGDVEAYLRSKEMTRILDEYNRSERLKRFSELPSIDDASKLSDVRKPE